MVFPPACRRLVDEANADGTGLLSRPSCKPLTSEVWKKILDKLGDSPKDLHRSSQTCLQLKTLLDKDKKLWGFEAILPKLLPYLNLSSTLTCRRVCSGWQEGIDRFVDNAPINRPYHEDHDDHPLAANANSIKHLQRLVQYKDFTIPGRLQRFLLKKKQWHGRRIIGGGVKIALWPHAVDDYMNNVRTFIKMQGPMITSLELNCSWHSGEVLYTSLGIFFRHCPNLRKLFLKESQMWPMPFPPALEALDNIVLETYPLPELPRLESLVIGGGTETVQGPLLAKYASQLKWLEMCLGRNIPGNLVNLTELAVIVHPGGRNVEENNRFLRNLLEIPAPQVKKMTIELCQVDLFLGTLLDICHQFSVQIMTIHGDADTQLIVPAGLLLRNVPSLKSFSFIDVAGVQNFNFLACFPSLEYLQLKGMYWTFQGNPTWQDLRTRPKPLYGVAASAGPEIVRVREFLYPRSEGEYDEMYESNVWILCPRLKRFDFEYKWEGHKFWVGRRGIKKDGLGENTRLTYTREKLRELYGF